MRSTLGRRPKTPGVCFVVDAAGTADVVVTGLAWRGQVYQQVFELSRWHT
jgi:hypothetical protein